MKKILLLTILLFSLIETKAQSFELNINPYEVKDTAKTMFFRIMANDDSTVTFYYELRNGNKIIEFRNVAMPIAAGQEVFKNPIDIEAINQWLAPWGIVVTGKKD